MGDGEILQVPSPADFHVHLRQGTMSALVTPHVALGGFKLAYVMVCLFISAPFICIDSPASAEYETPDYKHPASTRIQKGTRSDRPADRVHDDALPISGAYSRRNPQGQSSWDCWYVSMPPTKARH
jgi:hypothetical protein